MIQLSHDYFLKLVGNIIPDDINVKDSLHVPVITVVAYHTLSPGCFVRFAKKGNNELVRGCEDYDSAIGIIDPFIHSQTIYTGAKCLLWLKPGSISSLTHVWTHPLFEQNVLPVPEKALNSIPEPALDSYHWLRQYADSLDEDLDELIAAANDYLDQGSYYSKGGKFESMSTSPEFWDHFAVLTGRNIGDVGAVGGNFFSCSC